LCESLLYHTGGPEKILLKTIDIFVVNSNFCELPCIIYQILDLATKELLFFLY